MNVLVTGGAGYIGAMLVPFLLADGHKVTVLDTMWFGNGGLPKDNGNLTVINGDVRSSFVESSKDQDAVIWLASISNNAMYGINYDLTHEVNTFIEDAPSTKFIYASSVAVLDPTSDYAKDKLYCEKSLDGSGAMIVRSASVCGYSPHMRFDLTINKMTHDAYKKGVITVNGGAQRRSHIHIRDVCDFYRLLLKKGVNGKTYSLWNIVHSIKDSAEQVAEVFRERGKQVRLDFHERTDDRSYGDELDGDSMREVGFSCRPVWDAVRDMIARFDSGLWKDTTNDLYWNINRNL